MNMRPPRAIPEMNEKELERFWSRVEKTENCWDWKSTKYLGYGVFGMKSKTWRAHRIAFTLIKGEIPPTLVIDHVCRNKACVNPDHLRAVTSDVNAVENSVGVTAINAKKTHCPKGHELSGENVRIYGKRGVGRNCLICYRANRLKNQRKYRAIALLTKGPRKPDGRLSSNDVRVIKERLAIGETNVALASVFNVSASTISRIKHDRTKRKQRITGSRGNE